MDAVIAESSVKNSFPGNRNVDLYSRMQTAVDATLNDRGRFQKVTHWQPASHGKTALLTDATHLCKNTIHQD